MKKTMFVLLVMLVVLMLKISEVQSSKPHQMCSKDEICPCTWEYYCTLTPQPTQITKQTPQPVGKLVDFNHYLNVLHEYIHSHSATP